MNGLVLGFRIGESVWVNKTKITVVRDGINIRLHFDGPDSVVREKLRQQQEAKRERIS